MFFTWFKQILEKMLLNDTSPLTKEQKEQAPSIVNNLITFIRQYSQINAENDIEIDVKVQILNQVYLSLSNSLQKDIKDINETLIGATVVAMKLNDDLKQYNSIFSYWLIPRYQYKTHHLHQMETAHLKKTQWKLHAKLETLLNIFNDADDHSKKEYYYDFILQQADSFNNNDNYLCQIASTLKEKINLDPEIINLIDIYIKNKMELKKNLNATLDDIFNKLIKIMEKDITLDLVSMKLFFDNRNDEVRENLNLLKQCINIASLKIPDKNASLFKDRIAQFFGDVFEKNTSLNEFNAHLEEIIKQECELLFDMINPCPKLNTNKTQRITM